MDQVSPLPNVFIVDDDFAVRDSLVAMLSNTGYKPECFASGEEVMERTRRLHRPTCVLLDIRMPNLNGLSVLHQLRSSNLPLRVVMMTGGADVPTAVKAMKEGASDFIEKPFSRSRLLSAVEAAMGSLQGGHEFDPDAQEILLRAGSLSPRENAVMRHLVDGHTSKEIARALAISPRTVEVYRHGVMKKMGAKRLCDLIKMALVVGLGTPDA